MVLVGVGVGVLVGFAIEVSALTSRDVVGVTDDNGVAEAEGVPEGDNPEKILTTSLICELVVFIEMNMAPVEVSLVTKDNEDIRESISENAPCTRRSPMSGVSRLRATVELFNNKAPFSTLSVI